MTPDEGLGPARLVGPLLYLYVGSSDVERDLAHYRGALGGELVWRFRAFGAEVAAVRLGPGPLVLLADHRAPGSCLPIWETGDLDAVRRALRDSGWEHEPVEVGVPDGPCLVLHDNSGNELGLLRADRPNALVAAWSDPTNERAVRES
jgi:hypothetical protein